jgi:hypothetical protein
MVERLPQAAGTLVSVQEGAPTAILRRFINRKWNNNQ